MSKQYNRAELRHARVRRITEKKTVVRYEPVSGGKPSVYSHIMYFIGVKGVDSIPSKIQRYDNNSGVPFRLPRIREERNVGLIGKLKALWHVGIKTALSLKYERGITKEEREEVKHLVAKARLEEDALYDLLGCGPYVSQTEPIGDEIITLDLTKLPSLEGRVIGDVRHGVTK